MAVRTLSIILKFDFWPRVVLSSIFHGFRRGFGRVLGGQNGPQIEIFVDFLGYASGDLIFDRILLDF